MPPTAAQAQPPYQQHGEEHDIQQGNKVLQRHLISPRVWYHDAEVHDVNHRYQEQHRGLHIMKTT